MKKGIVTILLILLQMLCTYALAETSPLYIFGKSGTGDFENDYLQRTNPDITWEGIDVAGNNSAKDIAFQMQTNHDCFDLYAIGYSYCGFPLLRDKGFCLDVSSYPEMLEIVTKMYPYLQDAVFNDGKLYAVPIGISASGWAYNPAVFDSLGLDSVPQTYAEFFDLAKWWIDTGCTQYPDYHLFLGPANSRKYLIEKIIHDYVNTCTLQGIAIDFKTTAFSRLLYAVDTLDTDALDLQNAEAVSGIAYGTDTLFALDVNYSNLSGSIEKQYMPLHLRFDTNDAWYPVDIRLFAINPKSSNIEMAVTYINAFFQDMDAEKKLTLFDDPSASPIENPSYEQAIEDNRFKMEAVLSADQQEDIDLIAMKEELQNEYSAIEKSRWLVTTEQIEQYSELTSHFRVREQNILERNFTNGTLEIQKLIERYIQHELTLDQFVDRANQVVTMILLEESK